MSQVFTKAESTGSTRARLLDAAEKLFSEQGFDRVSVRDITEEASANVAAVNYHFGSREGLVEQVMARYINPIHEERLARLDNLERRSGGKPIAVEEILDALMRPFVTQVRKSELSEQMFYRLMGRIFGKEVPQVPSAVLEGFEKVLSRFSRALGKALPDLDQAEILWRIHFTAGAMYHTMAHSENLKIISRGASGEPSMESTITSLIRFASAGMREGTALGDGKDPSGPQEEFLF